MATSRSYGLEFGRSDDPSPSSAHSHGMTSLSLGGLDPHHDDDAGTATDDQHGDMDPASAPAWANQKTKAGKDRRRLPQACISCRRRKIKCSGDTPVCKHCERSRIPCVYKVTTRKAAPRTDYMAMLDRRLKRMEERVIKIMPKSDKRNLDVIGRAVVKPAQPGQMKPEVKKRAAQDAFDGDLDDWADSKGRTDGKRLSIDAQALHNDLMSDGADALPSVELQQHLAEVFFDYAYGQSYPLLHKPSYMRNLKAGTVPPVLILSVCALAARFSTHPEVRSEPVFMRGEVWAKPARDIALKRYDIPSITVLICYLILGLHEFGTCQGGRSWMLGGMAQRMAYALQLHKEIDTTKVSKLRDQEDLTSTDREIRRRTMWSCFMMDRFTSSGTDRPLYVDEEHIEAQLPVKEQLFQMEVPALTEQINGQTARVVDGDNGASTNAKDNMGVAAYLVKALSLWGQVVQYFNLGGREKDTEPIASPKSGFAALQKTVRAFKEELPESLLYNDTNLQAHATQGIANQLIFLHIVVQQVILFMNRFALPTPGQRALFSQDMPEEMIHESARMAMDAAGTISTLANDALNYRVTAPFAGYAAFLSSTVHIAGLSSRNTSVEASSKQFLAWNVRLLNSMKTWWSTFHFVAEHLKDLYRKQMDANARLQQGAETPNGTKAPEGILQYGDWFDKYPRGVSGGDEEKAAHDVKKEAGSDSLFGHKTDLQTVDEFFSKMSAPPKAANPRKAAKRKQSKSAVNTLPHRKPPAPGADPAAVLSLQQSTPATLSYSMPTLPMTANGNAMPGAGANGQQHGAFVAPGQQPYNASPIPNDIALLQAQQQQSQQQQQQFQMQQQQNGIMSELDRQMVLSSYAGLNGMSGVLAPWPVLNGMVAFVPLPESVNMPEGAQFAFPDQTSMGMPGDSLSWFLPFNHDPPAMGDEASSLFDTGSYDFGSPFGSGAYDVLGAAGNNLAERGGRTPGN